MDKLEVYLEALRKIKNLSCCANCESCDGCGIGVQAIKKIVKDALEGK